MRAGPAQPGKRYRKLPGSRLTVAHAGAQQRDGAPRLVRVAVQVRVVGGAVPVVAHRRLDILHGRGAGWVGGAQLMAGWHVPAPRTHPPKPAPHRREPAPPCTRPQHPRQLSPGTPHTPPALHQRPTPARPPTRTPQLVRRGPHERGLRQHVGAVGGGGAGAKQALQQADARVRVVDVVGAVAHEGGEEVEGAPRARVVQPSLHRKVQQPRGGQH